MSEKRFGGTGESPNWYQWTWHILNLARDQEERHDLITSLAEQALSMVNPSLLNLSKTSNDLSSQNPAFAKEVGDKLGGPLGEKVAELLARGASLEEIECLAREANISL